jgi:hypothetical protein
MNVVLPILALVFAIAVLGVVRWINSPKRPPFKPIAKSTARVLSIVFVLYLLSIGPASYLCCELGNPVWFAHGMNRVYSPMTWASAKGPGWLKRGIDWYCIRWLNAAQHSSSVGT